MPAEPDSPLYGTPGQWLSRPLLPLALAFCVGIVLEDALALAPAIWLLAATATLVAAGVARWGGIRGLVLPLLVLGFGCLGGQAMAGALFGSPAYHLSRLPETSLDAPLPLEGWVVGPPDPRPAESRDAGDPERTRFVIEVTRVRLDEAWVRARGQARLTVLGEAIEVAYGDEIRGTFRLRHPRRFDNPGSFDYPRYLATQGIALEGWTRDAVEVLGASRGSPILAAIFRLRSLLLRRLDAAMPAPEAALLKATILGDRSGLTPEMNQAFLDSGTYHILAISGLNVSLLAGTLFGLFRLLRASSRVAAAASILLVTLYAALAGASPSVIRAAVMADTYLLAVVLDRRADLLNSLALSALGLLWWNPRYLLDVGFQLTYLATLGIVLLLPRCDRALAELPRLLRWLLESVVITLAATAMTLPVLAAAFNRLAPVGFLANIPIVPLSGLITGLGTAAGAVILVVPEGLPWLNQLNGWLVDVLFAAARWFASWPWSSLRVYTPTPGMLVTYYGLVTAWLLHTPSAEGGGDRAGHRPLARWLALACSTMLAVQVVLRFHPWEGPPTVRLTLLDVGQGEAIFLELPGGRRMLVDAGSLGGDGFDVGLRVVAPYLWHEWVGRLDALVLTHAEADHINGMPSILRHFSVGEVWAPDIPTTSATALWIQEYARYRRIPYRIVVAGGPPGRVGEAVIEVLHPPAREQSSTPEAAGKRSRSNATSLVMRVSLGDRAILLTGDVERDGEEVLLQGQKGIRAQVLKVPHHGSRTASTLPFLTAVRPEVALVSVGYRNRFRHPHPEVQERYRALHVRLLRTDLHGAITVEMTRESIRAWGRREGEPSAISTQPSSSEDQSSAEH
jgi:competence protein ComEC